MKLVRIFVIMRSPHRLLCPQITVVAWHTAIRLMLVVLNRVNSELRYFLGLFHFWRWEANPVIQIVLLFFLFIFYVFLSCLFKVFLQAFSCWIEIFLIIVCGSWGLILFILLICVAIS